MAAAYKPRGFGMRPTLSAFWSWTSAPPALWEIHFFYLNHLAWTDQEKTLVILQERYWTCGIRTEGYKKGDQKTRMSIWKLKMWYLSPGWCVSVDWGLACEPKGYQFASQSGHMPGLQTRSPVGGVQGNWLMFSLTHRCFSPSLPLSLKINTIFIKMWYLALC